MERVSGEKVELSSYYSSVEQKKRFEIEAAYTAINYKTASLERVLNSMRGSNLNLVGKNVTEKIYDNLPMNFNMNMLNILEELIIIGNRTFPY